MLQYLIDNKKIVPVTNVSSRNLHIISDDVLEMIQTGQEGWEELVPHKVAHEIKEKKLFDYVEPSKVTS